MDEKEILEKSAKAKAARSGWAADAISRVVAAGQSLIAKREQVKTASAPERMSPFSNNQPQVGPRLESGAAQTGPRDLRTVSAMDKDRQVSETVYSARKLLETKLGKMPIMASRIHYIKADISRWDDHTGKPQTGRISFQIPFEGPQGDPRTIYASVDLVMGGLMEPRTFSDGMNKVYAFDTSGLKEMFQGQNFEVVHQPKVTPQIKYMGPESHAPDGIPGSVAAVNSPLIFKKASSEIVHRASGEKPTIAREGLVRPLSREAMDMPQPITPEQAKRPQPVVKKVDPAGAGTGFNAGTSPESNTGYPSGDQAAGHQTLAGVEVREINWDGTIRTTAKGEDLGKMLEMAHAMTYGGHDYVVEVWNGGSLVEHIASTRGSVRVASGLSKVIQDLDRLDVRMISFNDVIMMSKQHGSEANISFESASKELAKAGIVLYRTAATEPNTALAYRLAHANRLRLAAPPIESPVSELPSAPEQPDMAQPAQAPGGQSGMGGKSEIAPPAGLDPIEFREFQALMDEYNNVWETTHQREMNNIKNGNAPHMGIDYTDLQLLYDKITAFQERAQSKKSQEIAGTPSDLAQQEKVKPADQQGPTPAPQPGETGDGSITPEKGKGLAGQAPSMTRRAIEQAMDMKERSVTILDGVDTVAANTRDIGAATGGGSSLPKSASTYDLDDDAKSQMSNMGLDPNNPDQIKQFMGTFKKMSSHSQKFPEACKNCKSLVVPNGYSALSEFKHTRLPFCGAAKKPGVGFLHAYFRDCTGYDPIVKDVPQKIESKAPESEQTEADVKKVVKPISEKRAAALPSAAPEAVYDKDSQTGVGLDIRKWCEQNGHYAPAGDVHPTHDWCTLWNTAVENLVKLPSGAVVPKSMSGQSSEPHGEGGPHQFGNTPNQTI